MVSTASPFFHYNRANYQSPNDFPVATTSDRTSTYAGGQINFAWSVPRNDMQAGLYGFGQHDSEVFGNVFNCTSSYAYFSQDKNVDCARFERPVKGH